MRNFAIYIKRKISPSLRLHLFTGIVAVCLSFIFSQDSWSQQVTLAWDPNIEPDLAGYIAHWGTSSRNYDYVTDVGNHTTCTIKGLAENQRYYFAITAYDSEYNESSYSEELTYVISSNGTDNPTSRDSGGGGCFIATAAFGSPVAKHVMILRQFRDKILLPNKLGRAAVVYYYKHSPPYADYIAAHDNLRRLIRWNLLPIIGLCWIILKLGFWPVLATSMLLQCFVVGIPIALNIRKVNKRSKFRKYIRSGQA